MGMCDRTFDDYIEGMRLLVDARIYLGRRRSRDDFWIHEDDLILSRAQLDVMDAMNALQKRGSDARPHA
jgi:hypothetical protein